VKLNVLSPRSEIFVSSQKCISPRLDTLAGKKIGLLNNNKPGAYAFQPYFEKALKEVVPAIEFRTWRIPSTRYPGKEKDVKALAKWSDGVIGFMGD
jgi:hypothetical protein